MSLSDFSAKEMTCEQKCSTTKKNGKPIDFTDLLFVLKIVLRCLFEFLVNGQCIFDSSYLVFTGVHMLKNYNEMTLVFS